MTYFMHVKTFIAVFFLCALISLEASAQFIYRPEKARPLYSRDTVKICIMGDMMMHASQIAKAQTPDGGYNFSPYFMHIEDRIASADIAIANLEFTHAGKPYTGYPAFSAPEQFSRYLAQCGFDVFLCANNHIFDRGSKGAERTLETYRRLHDGYGVEYCGIAADEDDMSRRNPLFITAKGIRCALINITYGTNTGADSLWPDVNYMGEKEDIKAALDSASEADIAIVLPHWGTEYELNHSPEQEHMAGWLVGNGADLIVGAHPHVVQDCGTIDNVQVIYSLGNAVSNMSAKDTQLELMAVIKIARHTDGDVTILPAEFVWLWCSRPGGYCDSYTVLPVEEFISRKDEWKGMWDYDKMMTTYRRVKAITGIEN